MVFPYEGTEQALSQETPELGEKLGETRYAILSRIQHNPEITIVKLAQELGLSTTAVEKQIALLKEQGYLKRIGPAKGGRWEVVAG